MERKVTVRWRGEVRSFEVATGKTAHEVISAETGIPRERLKILLKVQLLTVGRRYRRRYCCLWHRRRRHNHRHPPLSARHPSPATRHPSLTTRHRRPPPATHHPRRHPRRHHTRAQGAQVQEDLGESEELIRKCADGAVAMLMGTPAAQQLDRTHEGWRGGANRGKNLLTDVMTR